MKLSHTLLISAVLHFCILGYAYTVDAPDEAPDIGHLVQYESAEVRVATAAFEPQFAQEGDEAASLEAAEAVSEVGEELEDDTEPAKEAAEAKPEPPEPENREPAEADEEPQETEESESDESEEESAARVASTNQVDDESDPVDEPVGVAPGARQTAVEESESGTPDGAIGGRGSGKSDSAARADVSDADKGQAARGGRGGDGGPDQDKLARAYGMTLFQVANSHKKYPRMARQARIEGKVWVKLTVDQRGKIVAVELARTSGHDILDRAAVDMIRRIEQFPPAPKGARWSRKTFKLPIKFEMG